MALTPNQAVANTHTTYNFKNNTVFYSLLNSAFLSFYNNTIRKAAFWLDGYDPSFHKDDMVSSRIATKLFNGFARSVFGRGLVFAKGKGNTDEKDDSVNYISHEWAEDADLDNTVRQAIGYCLSLGTSAIKINVAGNGKLWVEPLRLDYFYFSVDGRKKVRSFTTFIRNFQSTENDQENYFLVEKRFFEIVKKPFDAEINGKKFTFAIDEEVAKVSYEIFSYRGVVQSNTMPAQINTKSSVNYNNLPDFVKKALRDDYGFIKVGKENARILPFKNYLGVELFFNEGGDITQPTLPFGRCLCFDCIADFIEYDMNKSYSIRDLYNSKGVVGTPKALSQGTLTGKAVPGTGGNMVELAPQTSLSAFNLPMFEFVPGLDPNTQKPIIVQFEMRAEEHEKKEMAILKSIAITVGVSPRSIASFLVQDGEKTDDQIQSEDDTITQWIKDHRKDYKKGLNNIIECVLNYEGKPNNVKVKFASDGLIKGDKQLETIEKKLDLGLIDKEDAIREINPDDDEEQLQAKIKKMKERELKKQQDAIIEMNNDGTFGNEDDKLF